MPLSPSLLQTGRTTAPISHESWQQIPGGEMSSVSVCVEISPALNLAYFFNGAELNVIWRRPGGIEAKIKLLSSYHQIDKIFVLF